MNMIEELNKLILEAIKDEAFPGANYAIVFPNKVYLGSLGNKSLYPNVEPNDVDTIYDMASLSKVVSTTSCIMKLIEMGKLNLNCTVKKIIPEFKHENITIWNLLTHTSGLPEGLAGLLKYRTKDEVLKAIYQTELKFITNEEIRYSDLGFVLLGVVVEKISKMPLNEFAKKYVFEPLKMENTTYNPKDIIRCAPTEERHDIIKDGIVRGNVHDETSYLLEGVAGHAGLFSTVKDCANFIQMILNDGVFEGKEIFSKVIINRLFNPEVKQQSVLKVNTLQRGLGWIVGGESASQGDLTSQKTIHHTGFTGTNIWIDKENQIGFCLLTNRVHPSRNNLKHMIVRARLANYIMSNYHKLEK